MKGLQRCEALSHVLICFVLLWPKVIVPMEHQNKFKTKQKYFFYLSKLRPRTKGDKPEEGGGVAGLLNETKNEAQFKSQSHIRNLWLLGFFG